MKTVPVTEIEKNVSKYLLEAAQQDVVITQDGKPLGVLSGFADEDDWFDYCLERHPRFLDHVARARESARQGKGIRLEELDRYLHETSPKEP